MKTYQVALMAACGGALISTGGGLAYWWLHRPAVASAGPSVPVPAVVSAVEQGPVEAVPAALAGAGWASQCSDYFAAYKFVDGWALEHNGRQTGRRHARYQKGDAGWKVILPGETQIYDLVDGRLHFRGWEIADQFIRPKQGSVMQRCANIDFADVAQATDIAGGVRDPLRFALWMAMNMNDALAAERIAMRMPSLEGGINMEGDADKAPDIDTMLSLTSTDVVAVIERIRARKASSVRATDAVPAVAKGQSEDVLQASASSSLADIQGRYMRSSLLLNETWSSLEPALRKAVLPEQRAWVRRKMAQCKGEAASYATDDPRYEMARMSCEIPLDRDRQLYLEHMAKSGAGA